MPTGIWSLRLRSGSAHWDLELAVEVRQCPLRPGSRGAHCDLQLAVEVRQCPLGSGARGGGPAVPTGIWTARRRRRVRRRRRRRRRALLKSSNPHLAGGEKLKLKKYGKQIKTMKTWGTKKMGKKIEKNHNRGSPPNTMVLN